MEKKVGSAPARRGKKVLSSDGIIPESRIHVEGVK